VEEQIKEDEMNGACSTYERGGECIVLVGKAHSKRLQESCMYRWYNIKINIKEIGWESMGWIHLAKGGMVTWPAFLDILQCRVIHFHGILEKHPASTFGAEE
jgi:hypothetical protein